MLIFSGADIIGTPAVPSFLTQARMKLLHILLTVASILLIVGAVKATSSNEDDRNSSGSFRKAGGILMTVGFAMIAIIHLFLWQASHALLHSQKHVSEVRYFVIPAI